MMGGVYYFQNTSLPKNYANYFSYTQNTNSPHPYFYPELWSLAVQEWFYFIFPIIIFGINFFKTKNKQKILLFVMLLIIFIITLIRIMKVNDENYFNIDYWDLNLRKQVITRFDSLFYGGLIAYMFLNYADFFKRYAKRFLWIGIVLLIASKILLAENWFYTNYIYLSATSIGAAFLLPYFYGLDFNLKIINKLITKISAISYAIYLVHLSPVMLLLVPNMLGFFVKIFPAAYENTHLIAYAVYWLLTLSLAAVMHRLVAEPASQFLLNEYASYKSPQTANSLPLGSIK